MSDVAKKSLTEIVNLIKKKEIKSEEVTASFIDNIKKDKKLNSFITNCNEHALEKAKSFDKNPKLDILLPGVPIAVKDLFCTKGVKTTAGSKMLENFIPNYESTITKNLWNEGAFLLGKLNCDEFAMGSSNETSYFGNVINPIAENTVPGGSSGGSASALASDLTPTTIGTDTGGSIRQPASFTGTVGLKPTYGLCSRWGIVAFASSLDQAGPLTNSVEDAALILNSINKHDFNDTTSSNHVREDYSIGINDKLDQKIKIGIPSDYLKDVSGDILSQIENTKKALIKHNVEFVDVEFKTTEYALSTYYILAPAEASSNLARYDGIRYGVREEGKSLDDIYLNSRTKGFGDEVTRRILIGAYVLSAGYYDAYYRQAQKVRRLIKDDFQRIFNDVDFILTPTTPNEAFKIGDKLDPISMYKNDIYTVPTSLAGLPGISIPSGLSTNGLPLGIQFIGNYFEEKKLLQIAALAEKELNFNEQ